MKKTGVHFDFWYGHTLKDADRVTVSFSDCECIYRGNLWKDGEPIGDFWSYDSVAIEKRFPGIFGA
jgi:hypothetical protein